MTTNIAQAALNVVAAALNVVAAALNVVAAPLNVVAAPLHVVAAPLHVVAAPLNVVAAPFIRDLGAVINREVVIALTIINLPMSTLNINMTTTTRHHVQLQTEGTQLKYLLPMSTLINEVTKGRRLVLMQAR